MPEFKNIVICFWSGLIYTNLYNSRGKIPRSKPQCFKISWINALPDHPMMMIRGQLINFFPFTQGNMSHVWVKPVELFKDERCDFITLRDKLSGEGNEPRLITVSRRIK